jgi:hypothetical protein
LDRDDFEQLVRRVALLEDERAILDTLYRYGHTIDYGLEEAWVDCFVDEGIYDIRARDPERISLRASGVGTPHASGVRYDGHAALGALVARTTRAPGRYHKHCLVEPRITITGDEADATSYWVRIDDVDGSPAFHSFGRYLDRLTRGSDGRWRFRERVVEIESI